MGVVLERDYDSFVTRTLDKIVRRSVQEQVFAPDQFWNWLYREGKNDGVDGGDRIRENIRTGKSTAVGFYQPMGGLNIDPQDNVTSAFYNFSRIAATIAISNDEYDRNKGQSVQVVSVLEDLVEEAHLSISDTLATAAFASDDTSDEMTLTGLGNLVSDTPTVTVAGDVDPAEFTSWRNQVDAVACSFLTTNNPTTAENAMELLMLNCLKSGAPRSSYRWFMPIALYAAYCKAARSRAAYHETKNVDTGQMEATFAGIPVDWDDKCPAGHIYLVSSTALNLRTLNSRNFKVSGPREDPEIDARYWREVWSGNLTTGHRRANGVITTATAV